MPAPSTPRSLAGRVAVVTGATSGIGHEVARGLAARGATTVVVGREERRVRAAADDIRRSDPASLVESIAVTDLSLLEDVRRLAATLLDRFPRIHILVNNAGAYYHRREVTAEGFERTLALNVLAPLVLTGRLAGRLVESAPATVVNVSSAAHRAYTVDFDDLQGSRKYAGFRAYGRSKLELLLLTRELARRLRGTGVTVNAVHPGFVRSGFALNNRGGISFGMRILGRLFGRSTVSGADTPTWVASSPADTGPTGEYFVNRRIASGSRASSDLEMAERLYEHLCALADETPLTVSDRPAAPERSGRPIPS